MQTNKPQNKAAESEENELRDEKLRPLREAAQHIAELIQMISADRELFVSDSDSPATRKVDTKTLKEISSVIKELSSVICELNGIVPEEKELPDSIRIEFDEQSFAASR